MADMEIHEHVVADGPTAELRNPLVHHNAESLSRYIQKHDEYSNWEARVLTRADESSEEMGASLFGTQAQRRRWLKKALSPAGPASSAFFSTASFSSGIS
jgi:hypothetical protein